MLFLLASGVLILYVISRLFQKKKAIPNPTTGYKPSPLLPSNTTTSFDEIYQLIRKEEGINYTAEKDGKDKNGNDLYSIGIGHQIQPNEQYLMTARLSEDDAILLFDKDIEKILADMNKNIKVPLNKNQQLALISLRYRIGPNYFNNSSLLKELNKGNYQKASELFKEWRLSGGQIVNGLVLRAERERVRFLTPPVFSGLYMQGNLSPLSQQTGAPKFFPTNIPKAPTPLPKFSTYPYTIPKLD
jgi:lysozyme